MLLKTLFCIQEDCLGSSNIQVTDDAGVRHCYFQLTFNDGLTNPFSFQQSANFREGIFMCSINSHIALFMNIYINIA